MASVRDDAHYMRAALHEAEKGRGQTSPNPAVGALIVSNGRVVAKGYHRRAGGAHAEVDCLRALGGASATNASLYVTLEPCSTAGRTPPCTDAIIKAGIRSVVIGATDPNPAHAGRGMKILRDAGISVRAGVLAVECASINEAFNKWIQTRRPLVIAKCGMSLDGRLSAPPGQGRWITGAAARRHANRFRAEVDAILIGAETLRVDDPRLTVRAVRGARQPWRVVLSRSGRLPADAQIFTDRFAERTLVYRGQELGAVLEDLGRREITSVLLEGGGDILGQAVDARLIDKVRIYVGATFTGGPVVAFAGSGAAYTAEGIALQDVAYERLASDVLVTANARYDARPSE